MLQGKQRICPDCDSADSTDIDRRDFLKAVSTGAAATAIGGSTLWAVPRLEAAPTPNSAAETTVKTLYEGLTDAQKKVVCFDWDHKDKERGLLRTHVSNFWAITKPFVASDFYTKDQQKLIFEVFKGIFNPDWHERIIRQLKDDHGGKPWGAGLSMAIFGQPGTGKFEFVLTGRHLTCRADGDSDAHVALGGPIFHGHAASGYNEKVHHPGNVFWHQAELANKVYQVLDGKQQETALVPRRPAETAVGFRGADGKYPGIPISDLARDQKEGVQKVLLGLIEPYRKEDQDKVQECLSKQGGLDKCSLAFYKDGDIGDDGEWDNPAVPLNSKNF